MTPVESCPASEHNMTQRRPKVYKNLDVASKKKMQIPMSSQRFVSLYPCAPLSPHRGQGDSELPSEEYSDFPSIREHKSTSDSFHTPTNRFRLRSSNSVLRKFGPEQRSSPTQSEPPPSPPRYSRRIKGLGGNDVFNTLEEPMKYPEVKTKSFTEAILLTR
jgi:hypothetical protein